MSRDCPDVTAYKLWMVASPYLVQQPVSLPSNSSESSQKDGRSAQIPISIPCQLTVPINATNSSRSVNQRQQTGKQRKKSVDATPNGSVVSKLLSESPSLTNHLSHEHFKVEFQSGKANFPSLSSPVSGGGSQFGRPEMTEPPRTVCQACGKWFRSRQQLSQHMLVHTDVRKYKCSFCGRAFKQPSHLQQHHRIHTGEKPYRCPLAGCARAFPQLSNLNHHLRNHDKPEPPTENTCSVCHRTYASEAVLKNHILKIHMCKTNKGSYSDDHGKLSANGTENTASQLPNSGTESTNRVRDIAPHLLPIKCASPQHLHSSFSPESIIRVPNGELVEHGTSGQSGKSEHLENKIKSSNISSGVSDKTIMASDYGEGAGGSVSPSNPHQLSHGKGSPVDGTQNGSVEKSEAKGGQKGYETEPSIVANLKPITREASNARGGERVGSLQDNYNYTLEFLEDVTDGTETYSVYKEISDVENKSFHKTCGKSVNPSCLTYNNGIGKRRTNATEDESRRPNGTMLARMTDAVGADDVHLVLQEESSECGEGGDGGVDLDQRVSTSRKRKAFQPQRVVYNEEYDGV